MAGGAALRSDRAGLENALIRPAGEKPTRRGLGGGQGADAAAGVG